MTTSFSALTEASRFVFTPGENGYGFHLEVRDGDAWRAVTARGNALIDGDSFDLRPDAVAQTGDGLRFSGSRVDADLRWQGTITPVSGTGWFHVRVGLESSGFDIGDHGAIEPQLTIDLGDLPPYERGDHVWFKTLVENPTRWNGEGRGNDFPALYYYDPYLKAKFTMFFDMTPMSWMGADTIARFESYHCGFRRLYRGRPGAEIGLLAEAQSGHRFPGGRQEFSWYLAVEHLDDEPTPPDERQALEELVRDCLPLLRSSSCHWPEGASSWADFTRGCAGDLMSTEHSWGSDEQGEFLLAYVDGRSDAWEVTMRARGREHGGVEPCIEAALWAICPLDALLATTPDTEYEALRDRLLAFVVAETGRERCQVLSGVSATMAPMGTWQYVYILSELWFLFADRDDAQLLARIRREIDEVAVPLATNVQYLFPLQFDKHTLSKIGPGSAYAVCGTYALLMVDLAERTGESRYLDEARHALRALANVPIDDALQEVVLIAHAIDAAARLHALTEEEEWDAARLRAQTLRMMYWYDDRTSERTAMSSQLGMFLACANINYPAFFENIEADARLAAGLAAEADPSATLRVLDYGRRNNFSFFPRCSPAMFGPMPLDYIPFEEVPILEGPNDAGFLGQEIYGAGFTFRAHLLWDAYAYAADREVMVVSLDGYHETARDGRSFYAFNSRDEAVATTIALPVAVGGAGSTVVFSGPDGSTSTHEIGAGESVPLSLGAGEWVGMHVAVHPAVRA